MFICRMRGLKTGLDEDDVTAFLQLQFASAEPEEGQVEGFLEKLPGSILGWARDALKFNV